MSRSTNTSNTTSVSKMPPTTSRRRSGAPRLRPDSSDIPREHFNIANRKNHKVKFDEDAIMKAESDNNCYNFRRYKLRNLPKYDDCKPYATESQDVKRLFKDEVKKLIEFAENDEPPTFNSHDCLRGADRKDFEELSHIADQISCISNVLTHDNSRHGVTFGYEAAGEAWESLVESRALLRTRYAKDEKHVEGGKPVIIEDFGQTERNGRAFHLLLDYILAVMAWWLVRCADSEYWRTQVLATLAQWAVKMKIVSRDPEICAESSLSATSGMIEQLKIETEENDMLVRIGDEKKDVRLVQTQTDYCNIYVEEKLSIRHSLNGILEKVLQALVQDDKSTTPAEFFEICTMIFRRDIEPDKSCKIFSHQRHGDVSVSSFLVQLSFCYSLTPLLNFYIGEIKHNEKPPRSAEGGYIKLSGHISEGNGTTPYYLQTHSMDHVVTLLVPLLLMQPSIAENVRQLTKSAMVFMDGKEILRGFAPPPPDFALELTLSTREWLDDSETSQVLDPDITSLSKSPLARTIPSSRADPPFKVPTDVARLRQDYTAKFDDMRKWRIRSADIVIYCRIYVRCVQGLAAILVLGGLAVPFSVGERITGVDPFQIATYTWLLAGFLLICAKSFYVDDWPWNDFLHGHVKCRSVSDLSEVSGIDPQVVLLFLLRSEWNNLLVTDGPYNGMFERSLERRGEKQKRDKKKDEDKGPNVVFSQGFSIDEPSHVNTLLASGMIVLKVRDGSGEHLICIEGRKGKYWDTSRAGVKGKWMTCPNFNVEQLENMSDENKGHTRERDVHMLERVDFRWARVLGIYVKDSKFG